MNLLVIVIDSVRADRLSCLGHGRPTSPTLDALAGAAVCSRAFFTPTTPTHPAITTLFTGQHPLTHGVVARSDRLELSRDAPWFAEVLARAGYATAAVDHIVDKGRWAWFGRGFGSYIHLRRGDEYIDCFRMNQAAIAWLRMHASQPFFLYMRYGDTHTPYVPPAKYRALFYGGDPTVTNLGSRRRAGGDPPHVLAVECTWMAKWSLRKNGFKVIVSREPDFYGNPPIELYDLRADPFERRSLTDERPDARDALSEDLESQIAARLAALGRRVDPVRAHGSLRDKIFRRPSFQRRMKRLLRSAFAPPPIRS